MFEENIDIDLDEILKDSEPLISSLKRYNSEPVQESKPRKEETFQSITGGSSTIPASQPQKFSDACMENIEVKRFCFKKTSSVSVEIESRLSSQNATTSGVSSAKIKNHADYVNKPIQRKESFNAMKRKFPGPAGLLPAKAFLNTEIGTLEKNTFSEEKDNLSQISSDVFNDGPWEKMRSDFHLNRVDGLYLPDEYTIEWIRKQITLNKLITQKAPFLAAFIYKISRHSIQNPIVNLVLKDKTGVIQGTILHDLYEKYAAELTIGSVIILREIGVLNIGSTIEPCLTITANNLMTIYTRSKGSTNTVDSVSKIIVQTIDVNEIFHRIHELEELYKISSKNANHSIHRIPSVTNLGQHSLSDDFTRALSNAHRDRNRTNRLNFNSLMIKSSSDWKNGKENSNISNLSGITKSTETMQNNTNTMESSKLMDIFDTQEDIDEFFKEDPVFCSTQINTSNKEIKLEVNFDRSSNVELKRKLSGKNSVSNSLSPKKYRNCENNEFKIVENIFEGIDANSLFDDF